MNYGARPRSPLLREGEIRAARHSLFVKASCKLKTRFGTCLFKPRENLNLDLRPTARWAQDSWPGQVSGAPCSAQARDIVLSSQIFMKELMGQAWAKGLSVTVFSALQSNPVKASSVIPISEIGRMRPRWTWNHTDLS